MRIQQLLRHLPRRNTKTKKDLPTLPAETSIEDSTKLDREKKVVVVVKSGEPDVKISDAQDQSEETKREDDNIGQ
jgi:hypothetical protein